MKISILGLGYVGLPLAVAFAEKYLVVGFDINSTRIKQLKNCSDSSLEVDSEDYTSLVNEETIIFDLKNIINSDYVDGR